MKLGGENKRTVYLVGLLMVGAAISVYVNFFSDSSAPVTPKPAVTAERNRASDEAAGSVPAPQPVSQTAVTAPRQFGGGGRSRSDEFHPTLRSKRKEEQIDTMSVDPTLRLDLLAKVQNVKLDGGQRNLFQFGKPEQVADPVDREHEPEVHR